MREDTILTYDINTYPCRGGYQPPVSICETRLTKGLTNAVLCDMIITDNIKEYIMEEPRSPIFSKKEKIIIASIFAILFLASIIVTAYLVNEGYPEDFGLINFLPFAFIFLVMIRARLAYIYRHKGNFIYREFSWMVLRNDREWTYDAVYLKFFYIYVLIFLAQIPFYIPFIVCIEGLEQLGWLVLIYFAPMLICFTLERIRMNLPAAKKEYNERLERIDREERENLQNRFRDKY